VGAGIARDLSMRGVSCILLRQRDSAYGFAGRCRGMVHSGAVYALTDPVAARECAFENRVLRMIAEPFLEDVGGLFVTLPGDEGDCAGRLMDALRQIDLPSRRLPAGKALEIEPALSPDVIEAVAVPDAVVDPYILAMANAESAERHGAQVHTDTAVDSLLVEGGEVRAVRTRCQRTGKEMELHARCIVNAAGGLSGAVAAMAGVTVPLRFSRLIFILIEGRLTRTVTHRCPGSSRAGGVVVPSGFRTILRVPSREAPDPGHTAVDTEEVDSLMEEAVQMVPGVGDARAIRAFAVIQTFLEIQRSSAPPAVHRGIVVLDHGVLHGAGGFFTVLGGTLTTYRRAAQAASDAVCRTLGNSAPCATYREVLPRPENYPPEKASCSRRQVLYPNGEPGSGEEVICRGCEVSRREIEEALQGLERADLNDIQRLTGAGTGVCQGGLCAAGLVSILGDMGALREDDSNMMLRAFLEERWRGVRPVAWGEHLREEELIRAVMLETLNLDRGA